MFPTVLSPTPAVRKGPGYALGWMGPFWRMPYNAELSELAPSHPQEGSYLDGPQSPLQTDSDLFHHFFPSSISKPGQKWALTYTV